MDTYIIRIYRRDPDDPIKISGLVETVGTEEKKVFTCIEELCKIFVPSERDSRKTLRGDSVLCGSTPLTR